MSLLFFVSSLVCLIFGLVHFFRGPLDTPLAISLLFMTYNLIPQGLLLQVGSCLSTGGQLAGWRLLLRCLTCCPPTHAPLLPPEQYTLYRKPLVFNAICKAAMLLSTILLVLGVVLVWLLYPRSYNYSQVGRGRGDGAGHQPAAVAANRLADDCCSPLPSRLHTAPTPPQALTDTLSFFDSQREGYLPPPAGGAGGAASAAAPWRGDAFISDYNTTATLASSLPNATNLFSVRACLGGSAAAAAVETRGGAASAADSCSHTLAALPSSSPNADGRLVRRRLWHRPFRFLQPGRPVCRVGGAAPGAGHGPFRRRRPLCGAHQRRRRRRWSGRPLCRWLGRRRR